MVTSETDTFWTNVNMSSTGSPTILPTSLEAFRKGRTQTLHDYLWFYLSVSRLYAYPFFMFFLDGRPARRVMLLVFAGVGISSIIPICIIAGAVIYLMYVIFITYCVKYLNNNNNNNN